MAEAASNVPTFKLVLVGDGGTGKVSYIEAGKCAAAAIPWKPHHSHLRRAVAHKKAGLKLTTA